MLDIHSHILPCVDDGAESIEESLQLLQIMKEQGITAVIATPHFYPHEDNLDDFLEKTAAAYKELCEAARNKGLPDIYLGSEILYFEGMGHSASLDNFCLNNSPYLLVELTDECIGDSLMANIKYLRQNSGIIPIIAHVERYFRAKKYRKFIKFLEKENIMVQINASSVTNADYDRVIAKLMKSGLRILLGTDTHSVDVRPPLMDKALNTISQKYGIQCYNKIVKNIDIFYNKIVTDGGLYD